MITKIRKVLVRYFAEMRWYSIVLALVFYGGSSWLLLNVAGETDILQLDNFVYWLVVTGSTVGYGDLSPTTTAGKYVVSFYVIPVGLSIFALVIGRIAAWVSEQWRKGVKGLKPLDLQNHIVVIGWNGQRTVHLINLLQRERAESIDNPDIVLCVKAEIENPLPGEVEFVRVTSFNKDEDMDKACIANAKVIVMDNPQDDLTMTTALYCSQRNPAAHKLAYFNDESLVKLLHQHCPNVECMPSVGVEMLAKSAFDPGSSLLHYDLLDLQFGQSQFSAQVPPSQSPISAATFLQVLKDKYDATFIGYISADNKQKVLLNPVKTALVNPGDKIFYISEQRLKNIDWQQF